ncbi:MULTISPECIES: polysaccharide deacetylase family protein [Rhodopseudomonas]|uniref:polysaccharide deacetylase family protein n=1 Tax=Rhodopseudomonas TaxID=1073 RepID=UPI0005CAAF1F|nr:MULTISPECIES: polysaccharide deacetylase family protein [Rhodopseudomonas]MDF3812587.1 polysaccharide deacetylase family protein [Rhodopseudomonas sp. BAL398]WOK17691.1 polysaccharide deacetylase family protein [Rhodopseudomonas sp. BAL398]
MQASESQGSWTERCAIELLHRTGLSHAAARWYGGCGAIYMLHSAAPDRHLHIDSDLRTTPRFLDRLLTHLRASRIDVVSLDTVAARLRQPHGRRFVAFTFDDGYADNFLHALPVFESHNAPFAVYVASGMVTGDLDCWWLGLERLFLQHSTVEIEPMQRRWCVDTLRSRARAYREACDWVSQDVCANAGALASSFRRYGIDLRSMTREVGLTVDQLKMLAHHPLVTIGGHTVTHPSLGQLSEAHAYDEIAQNKRFLEELGGQPVDHFAYPFGRPDSCGPREAALVRKAGFCTATTTHHGCLTEPLNRDLHLLPRVGINRPYESVALARLQIDGLVAAVRQVKAAATMSPAYRTSPRA